MKVLTVRQPWAWAIIHGGKNVENRSRRITYRGPLAIHAGLGFEKFTMAGRLHKAMHRSQVDTELVFGAIIGTVDVVDCIQDSTSDWAIDGYWHWILANPQPLPEPIPAKGRLGLWEFDIHTTTTTTKGTK